MADQGSALTGTFTLAAPRLPSMRLLLAGAGLLVLLTASVVLAIDAAAAPSFLVPGGRHAFPGWLSGPLSGLGERTTWNTLGTLLIAMIAGWALVLAGARALPARALIGAIVAAHVVFLLAPPLLSADVFGYVGFARLGVLHHLNPYAFGTGSAAGDAVHPFLRWHDAMSPYGPLFTLLSYALVPLGVAGALWAFKTIAFAASLATIALVWRLSERLGKDPRSAVVLVGLNPVLLAFEVGGGHNDALVMLGTVAGIGLVLSNRAASGTAATVLAAAAKPSAALVAPFAIIGSSDRRRALAGGAAALAAAGIAAWAGFGTHALGFLHTAPPFSAGVAAHSVPAALARAVGGGSVTLGWRMLGAAIAVAVLCWALWRAAHGADWITCAGWATLAVLVTTTWLLPWYATWLTPLAALGDSRRLKIATVLFVIYAAATRITFIPT